MFRIRRKIMVPTLIIIFSATLAVADWIPEDGHKMHFPQPPDEAGWDVYSGDMTSLGDDWMCGETGWVKEIHFWGSWIAGDAGYIESFNIRIRADIPPNPPDFPYSRPGQLLWEQVIPINKVTVRPLTSPVPQGFLVPPESHFPDDHTQYYQYNIFLPDSLWFWQEEGTIYWLVIHPVESGDELWGWKSSTEQWNDNAVYYSPIWMTWKPVYMPPDFTEPLDLAFVINGDSLPATGACCYYEGETYACIVTSEDDCINNLQGSYQGYNTSCGDIQACCLPDGGCVEADPMCCVSELGGTPQGTGTTCGDPVACCLPGGGCIEISGLCCDELGGMVSSLSDYCLGDQNQDGIDDGCEMVCYADGDVNGDMAFNIGDAVYLVGFLRFGVYELYPGPYNADINGDGYVDYGDVDMYICVGDYGYSCFDTVGGYPVPTTCVPELTTGACCRSGECDLRAGVNCESIGGEYQGDGTSCWPDNPCGDTCDYQNPGDVNNDGTYDISDGVYLIEWLTGVGPAPPILANADPNGDCCVDEGDAIYLEDFLYHGGPAPVACTCVEPFYCDCFPGDMNLDFQLNIGDAVFLIAFIFKGGPYPGPYEICSCDANCDCQCNIGDAVYIINWIFKGGPRPCFCCEWRETCGPTLHK